MAMIIVSKSIEVFFFLNSCMVGVNPGTPVVDLKDSSSRVVYHKRSGIVLDEVVEPCTDGC